MPKLLTLSAWLCSLIEGEELLDYMGKALEKVKGNNLTQVVAPMLKRLLQVCALLLFTFPQVLHHALRY